jgi:DHA1 family multidrug resistance protein-like MFS transporter
LALHPPCLQDIYKVPLLSPPLLDNFNMSDLLRESLAGQLIRHFTGNKVFKYAEEKEDFHCPTSYAPYDAADMAFRRGSASPTPHVSPTPSIDEKLEEVPSPESETAPPPRPENPATATDSSLPPEVEATRTATHVPEALSRMTSRVNMEKVTTRQDLERAYTEATMRSQLKNGPAQPIVPEKTADGIILVDWYDTNDQENPQNWSFGKKCVVATQI